MAAVRGVLLYGLCAAGHRAVHCCAVGVLQFCTIGPWLTTACVRIIQATRQTAGRMGADYDREAIGAFSSEV